MTDIFLVSFLVIASYYLGGWTQNQRTRKLVKGAAMYKIAEYFGVTNEAEDEALQLYATRKLYPKGRGSFHND